MSRTYTHQLPLYPSCKHTWLLPILWMLVGCAPSSPITYLDWGLDQKPVRDGNEGEQTKRASVAPDQVTLQSCLRSADFEWPIKGSLIHRFSEGSKETANPGIDILGSKDDPVIAAWDGKVTFAGDLRGYGKVVLIAHCETLTGVYANLSALSVKRGDRVLKGQNLGVLSLSEGQADPVLHFELREKTLPIDPMRHLKNKNSGEANLRSVLH